MKMSKFRLVSVIIGMLAILGLVGPFIFGSIFELVVDYVPDMVKIIVSVLFLVVNTITIKFGGNKVWRWMSFILSIVVLSFWMDTLIMEGIVAWKECTLVRTVSIIVLAISVVVNVIDFLVARKTAVSE